MLRNYSLANTYCLVRNNKRPLSFSDSSSINRNLYAAGPISSPPVLYHRLHSCKEQQKAPFKVANPPALILFQVAIQCLETVFKISPEDTHLAVSQPLTEMFTNSVCKVCWHFFSQ